MWSKTYLHQVNYLRYWAWEPDCYVDVNNNNNNYYTGKLTSSTCVHWSSAYYRSICKTFLFVFTTMTVCFYFHILFLTSFCKFSLKLGLYTLQLHNWCSTRQAYIPVYGNVPSALSLWYHFKANVWISFWCWRLTSRQQV